MLYLHTHTHTRKPQLHLNKEPDTQRRDADGISQTNETRVRALYTEIVRECENRKMKAS